MPVVPSGYWNEVHGNAPEEVRQDLEGMQIIHSGIPGIFFQVPYKCVSHLRLV